MDARDLVPVLAALGVAVAVYLQMRRFRTARANVRALLARGYQRKRLLPWMPLSKLMWRLGDETAIVLEHHHSTGDDGVFEYTRLGFFGCSCVPTSVWADAAEFSELAGFAVRRGGFMVVLENQSQDAISKSSSFPDTLEMWASEFASIMERASSLPRDVVCGACGRLVDDEAPQQRARCQCGAVYHLKCADVLGGECARWNCATHEGSDEPNRLLAMLRQSLPR